MTEEDSIHTTAPNHELIVYLCSIFFFYSAHVGFESIMQVLPYLTDARGGEFGKLKYNEKQEYFARQVASLHALIASPLAIYSIWYSCKNNTSLLSDDICLITP